MGDNKSDRGLHIDSLDIDIVVNPAGKKGDDCLFCVAGIYRNSVPLGFIYYYSDKPIPTDILIRAWNSGVILSTVNNGDWMIDAALFTKTEGAKLYDELYWIPVKQRNIECKISDDDEFLYEVRTDSFIDYSSTMREGHKDLPSFQNNYLFRIENTGNTEVSITDISINDRSWWTFEGLLHDAGITDKGESAVEEIKKLWDFTRKNVSCGITYQHLFKGNMEDISLLDFFNSLGTGACGTYNSLLALFGASRGIPARRLSLSDGSHIIAQTLIENRDFVLDAFYGADEEGQGVRGSFFLNDQRQPASYDDLCHDHYLVNRSGRFRIGELASLFGYHDSPQKKWLHEYNDAGHMNVRLFSGESIEWRMHTIHAETGNPARQTGSFCLSNNIENGRFIIPDSITVTEDNVISEQSSALSCRISIPYPIYGIKASLKLKHGNLTFDTKTERGKVCREFSNEHGGLPIDINVILDESECAILFDEQSRTVEIEIKSGENTEYILSGIELFFHAYGKSLMTLKKGNNFCRLGFSDKSSKKHLSLTHQLLEFPNAALPIPEPPQIIFEGLSAKNHGSMAVMKLHSQSSDNLTSNELIYDYIISDNPECIIPVGPIYQSLTRETEILISNSGLLQAGSVYYARARSINVAGAAGAWGKPVLFKPTSLPSPVWSDTEYLNDRIVLHWTGDSLDKAVQYDIYGSREQGFRPSKNPYDVWIRRIDDPAVFAKYPANYIGTSSDNSFSMKYTDFSDTGSFPSHLRIIPYTSRITGSPGEMLSLNTPFIFSASILQRAAANEPYSCFIKSILSIGSLHFNRLPDKPMYTEFLNKEKPVFELVGNPQWLEIRAHDGYMSGTPGSGDRGIHRFSVRCTTHNGSHSVEASIEVI
ncbi:MAG: transglutaminase domain-containing protein [Clostridia bacterium]|nr:transglutaminase domain-containing protein [Clostridia bacterium]